MTYQWDFSVLAANWETLAWGLANTFRVFVVALALGLPIGLALALMRLSSLRPLALAAGLFIELLRGTPGIVLLFWFFFAAPLLIGVQAGPYGASIAALSILSAAFYAEAFRAGIVSVERGQIEAARAIAMSEAQVMRRVVLPIAVKRMLPALFERSVELLKGTTLVSTVSFADLMFRANDVVQLTFRPLEVYTAVALAYFVIIFGFSQLAGLLETRLARSGESGGH
ncbi:MAG: amino acid ABC transporter permease [Methylobacteriaceae bacterium]|nr:amino acid ABC transporter permease [Methylobacteriaceae bacterium]